MFTVLYGAKTFVLDNKGAAELVEIAADHKRVGNDETASQWLSLAVKVEAGRLSVTDAHFEMSDLAIAA